MSFIPNTTPTPNWLYNGEMKKMNETELKVVLLVTRKTLGWFDPLTNERKSQDNISQSQFMEFTGKSHTAIAQAIQSSVEMGWIIARDVNGNLCDTSEKRKRRRVWYQLGSIFTDKISKQQSGQDENLSNITQKSKQHNASNLSNKVDNTKETITKVNNTKEDTATQALQEEIKEGSLIEIQEPSQKQGVPQLIKLFEDINPDYEDWFRNTTQRASAEKLLLRAPFNKLEELITGIMPILNSTPYNPKDCKAFSPFELNKNWAKIMAKIKEKSVEAIQDKGRGIRVSGL